MMKSALAGFALAALTVPAVAVDMAAPYNKAPPPVMSWSGCYVGADIGAAWSAQDITNTSAPGLDQSGVVGTINGAGAIGGGYAGCNLQWTSMWVVGIEGDFSAAHLGGTVDAPNLFANGNPAPTGGIGWTGHLDSIGTVRGSDMSGVPTSCSSSLPAEPGGARATAHSTFWPEVVRLAR
jgi:hypothetical protein